MSMRALAKEIAQVGLGVLSLTLEKAEAVVEALAKRREIRREGMDDLMDHLTTGRDVEYQALRKVVKEESQRALSGLNLATRTDIDTLSNKMDVLGRQLNEFLS